MALVSAGPVLALAASACTGASSGTHPAAVTAPAVTTTIPGTTIPGTTIPGTPPASTPPPGAPPEYPAVTVTDAAGAVFVATAAPVVAEVVVDVDGQPRFAPPQQAYLTETLHLALAPGQGPHSLSDFDDRTSGLANDIELVLDAPVAAARGYGAACGREAGYAPAQCPITLGQGLTVDSDSVADPSSPGALGPGTSAVVVVSYGPVPWSFPVGSLSVWFHAPPLLPRRLSP